ncbi:MAG: c-type cytochrome domain-containing protein, partial [Actinomycetota bacterium]
MRIVYLGLTAAAAALLAQSPAGAQAGKVSFSKDLVPILKESCVKCHSTRQPQGGFAVSSFALIEKGGKGGKALAAKPEDSRLIKYLEGTLKPKMPIGGSLTKPQIDKFKAWIAQGAKSDVDVNALVIPDSAIPEVKVPVIKVKVPILPQAASLAWSKDNKVLAVGAYKTVRLVDPTTGMTIRELAGLIQSKLELEGGTVVPLNEEGSQPPLFLIAGAGGHVFTFHKFARLLGQDFPAYGMKAIGV